MLYLSEKYIFGLAILASGYFTGRGFFRIYRIIRAGQGQPNWKLVPSRIGRTLTKFISLAPTWKTRLSTSIFHALIAWGFAYYLLVNLEDVLSAYQPEFKLFGNVLLGNLFRLGADLFSIATIVGVLYMITRRFLFKPRVLGHREQTLLHPKARIGIARDSAIVGAFTLLHVGFRIIGESYQIALSAQPDAWQPFASGLASLWGTWSDSNIVIAMHLFFWLTQGLVIIFLPYFPHSKHIHLIFAPLNFLLKPQRSSMGTLSALDFEDESVESFGVTFMEDLGYEQILDAYACVMCNRCTEVCPAHITGKDLSPAALEINKRYFLNEEGHKLASGKPSEARLIDFAISKEAVWACTACGACVDICPVGIEPMRDILDIRRSLVLMENSFPSDLKNAYRGMERVGNPWNIPATERMSWAEGLHVPTIEVNPNPDYLWWVGCAAATDPGAQKTARALAKILNHAQVDYAVLGRQESCTGDSARRSGNEFLFSELASKNVTVLNDIQAKKIITTCPHCMHTIMNEYPAFGGHYQVVHHTALINDLINSGRLQLRPEKLEKTITFHDPCFLGRQNGILIDPRDVIEKTGAKLTEMTRHGKQSFCCGAGGAQMWKEEEKGVKAVNAERFREAENTAAEILAVGCPFCRVMMNDAANDNTSKMQVLDVVEVIAAQLG